MHLAFGADLINTIVEENPEIWTKDFQKKITDNIVTGVKLECEYAEDALPKGIMGLRSDVIRKYLEYIANRRLTRIGLPEKFQNAENPFPWMNEMIDLKKEKNFFETRVTEYQGAGALTWE